MAWRPKRGIMESKCPNCKTDVLETGFFVKAQSRTTYMRIGSEVLRTAFAEEAQSEAYCLCCGETQRRTASELRGRRAA